MSGEFAGYAVDEAVDAENDRWLYRQGVMSDHVAYELGIIDHHGFYNHRSQSKTCRYCGKSGLSWKNTPDGWRLASGATVHVCVEYNPNRIVDLF